MYDCTRPETAERPGDIPRIFIKLGVLMSEQSSEKLDWPAKEEAL